MIYGYARISRKEQNIERQIRNIKKDYPDAMIIQEAFTGTTTERPDFQRLKKMLKPGDTLVFDSVSRMSRNAAEGFQEYVSLYQNNISLVFLKEPHINTETYKAALSGKVEMTGTDVDIILDAVNRYLMKLAEQQIRLAFEQAQKEVDDLHQRTREGLVTARMNGAKLGRPAGRTNTAREQKVKNKMLKRAKAFGGDLSDADCMSVLHVSRGTYYRYKKELLNEKGQVVGQLVFPL